MQFALFGLLTAILALKRPYLTLDLWVQRSPHDIGLSPTMWAGDRLTVGLLNRGGFSPCFNQFCHAPPLAISLNGNWTASAAPKLDGCQHCKADFHCGFPPDPTRTDCRLAGMAGATCIFPPGRLPDTARQRAHQRPYPHRRGLSLMGLPIVFPAAGLGRYFSKSARFYWSGRGEAEPYPLYPRKRTSAGTTEMSAKCQKRTGRSISTAEEFFRVRPDRFARPA
jgi:hypothetical protein